MDCGSKRTLFVTLNMSHPMINFTRIRDAEGLVDALVPVEE
jgi:hypothetical protein